MTEKKRCSWCNAGNARYVGYHDREWGRPRFDDAYLFEMLTLESFQAGLSWECVLNKREGFRRAYDGFDPQKVAAYDQEKIDALTENREIIRNRRKIAASIRNAAVFQAIAEEYGSFDDYLKAFTKGRTFYETGKTTNALSDALSKDLKKRGMSFVGSVIVYAYLQSIGVVYSHEEGCWLYRAGDPADGADGEWSSDEGDEDGTALAGGRA